MKLCLILVFHFNLVIFFQLVLYYAEDIVAYLDLSNWHSFTYSGVKRHGGKCQDTKPLKNLIHAVEGLVRRHFPQAMDVKEMEKNVWLLSLQLHKNKIQGIHQAKDSGLQEKRLL